MRLLSEIIISLSPALKLQHEPTRDHLIKIIIENEYGSPILKK